jgi:hypothetical protein
MLSHARRPCTHPAYVFQPEQPNYAQEIPQDQSRRQRRPSISALAFSESEHDQRQGERDERAHQAQEEIRREGQEEQQGYADEKAKDKRQRHERKERKTAAGAGVIPRHLHAHAEPQRQPHNPERPECFPVCRTLPVDENARQRGKQRENAGGNADSGRGQGDKPVFQQFPQHAAHAVAKGGGGREAGATMINSSIEACQPHQSQAKPQAQSRSQKRLPIFVLAFPGAESDPDQGERDEDVPDAQEIHLQGRVEQQGDADTEGQYAQEKDNGKQREYEQNGQDGDKDDYDAQTRRQQYP